MYVPANEIQPGSRNFMEAQSTQTGVAVRINSIGFGMFGVVTLTIVIGLVVEMS